MTKSGCASAACGYRGVGLAERLLVTAFASGFVLAFPLANNLGVSNAQNLLDAHYVINLAALLPVAAWFGSMYLAWKEDADSHWNVGLNAIGIPGTVMALLSFVSK